MSLLKAENFEGYNIIKVSGVFLEIEVVRTSPGG